YVSLYAQFFHQMAAQIEALTVKILYRNGYERPDFRRAKFYTFLGNDQKAIAGIDGHSEYAKMYVIWNFVKHNSLSAYKTIKEEFVDVLYDNDYHQGSFGCYYVKFSDELMNSILAGVELFLKGYCELVLHEDPREAHWNYEDYFLSAVEDEIGGFVNPLGIPDWI
ncbi:MAG TPA: hypothetical protein VMW69_07765, partial [Spirochaetia bacterium]|nr:hypothetical protein [Spirochaetia bacterium]